ncbi:ABC transporter permease [Desulfurobacterium atlanticum]|uniref:Nucleoside ABC transporter membrane protein n=1 Tax=Desulfurobacterium atlanticum TaxID=240169 RepID=A0A238XN92_9BACT|nr:ABC transporter permease [Desulfurobacterium atlanticum]SNR60496.1 nucleoside ABC transporter membrane protein [Desulfurobacterium atlanticum]
MNTKIVTSDGIKLYRKLKRKERIKELLKPIVRIGVVILSVFLITTLLLLAIGVNPFEVYTLLLKGALGSKYRIARVLNVWIPLTLCACGLLYTFSLGLWNIGIEGQIMLGAVGATAAFKWLYPQFPAKYVLMAGFLAAVLFAGIWALLAGILKTKGGVNEIFAGLGLNFVAQGLILWLIFGPWKRPGIASMSGTEPFSRELWLSVIRGFKVAPAGLIMAVVFFLFTVFVFKYTRLGLFFKAIGDNPTAGTLFGISVNRYSLLAMFFAGSAAGMAGFFQTAGVYHRLIPAISSNYGYLALLVVMLANFKYWPVPFIAFFFACLNVGSIQLPMVLKIDSSLSGIIQGLSVLVFLIVYNFQKLGERKK